MAGSDDIADLAAEFRSMSTREQRAVLRSLDDRERRTLEEVVADLADETRSAWIADRCREAELDGGPVTVAVRRVLLSLRDAAPSADAARGPSLAGRVGALLGSAR